MILRVNQDILWLNITMTNTASMNVADASEHLISVHLYQKIRYWLLHLYIMSHNAIDCVRDVVHNDVQVNFILLFTLCEESMFHFYYIRVV